MRNFILLFGLVVTFERERRSNSYGPEPGGRMCVKIKPHFPTLLLLILLSFNPAGAGDLQLAIEKGDLEAVKKHLDKDVELLNKGDEEGKTPLHHAIEMEKNDIAKYLIEQGADINQADDEKESPLHYAASSGNLEVANLLLEKGTTTLNDVSSVKHDGFVGGWTPLHIASLNGHPEVVRLLLDRGADIEARDAVERTPLIITAQSHNLEVAEVLIDRGADINAQAIRGYTTLLWAAENDFEDLVNYLITREADIQEEALQLAFQTAVVNGLNRLYEYVQEKGLDLAEVKERDPGIITAVCKGGSIEVVESLLQHGFDLEFTDSYGWRPLHYAASGGRVDIIGYILSKGVDIDARSKVGETAYNVALSRGHKEAADHLKRAGADVSEPEFPVLEGPYMGQKPPGDEPEMFLPGIVSGRYRAHSSIVFSPDGKEAYWTEMTAPGGRVMVMRMVGNKWSYEESSEVERDPSFSPDGRRLYFIKTRPFRKGEKPGGDKNFKEEYWYLKRTDGGWSEPVSVGDAVNVIGVHWPCSVDKDGNLYFSEFSENMYFSQYRNGRYQQPVKLTTFFNNETFKGHSPFISPDGDCLLFCSNDSLHISFKEKDGSWTDKINLGNQINGSHVNGSPRLSPDGKYLFFVSAGQGRPWGIYWVSTGVIERLRSEQLSDE